MNPTQIVNLYLESFYTGDFNTVREILSESMHFQGPFVTEASRENFLKAASGLLAIVKGHELHHQWADGDNVCSIYSAHFQTPVGSGSVLMSEWHILESGRITSGKVIFDTAAFKALMPVAGDK